MFLYKAGNNSEVTYEDLLQDLAQRGIKSQKVLQAMRQTQRRLFLSSHLDEAHADKPLSIGFGQTISQPWMVAAMTSALDLQGYERVLEIGTGSGYQTAILSLLCAEVYTVERIPELAKVARQRLEALERDNVYQLVGDGTLGWPEEAPFHAILVTAASPDIPPPLLEQLALGGRLLVPVESGKADQLVKVVRKADGFREQVLMECRFVPLIGEFGYSEEITRK